MELAYGCMDAMLNSGWLPAWMPAKMVPVAMRHDAAGSWLRAPAEPGSARARTRARQGPGPAGARGAAVRIDFCETRSGMRALLQKMTDLGPSFFLQ